MVNKDLKHFFKKVMLIEIVLKLFENRLTYLELLK